MRKFSKVKIGEVSSRKKGVLTILEMERQPRRGIADVAQIQRMIREELARTISLQIEADLTYAIAVLEFSNDTIH